MKSCYCTASDSQHATFGLHQKTKGSTVFTVVHGETQGYLYPSNPKSIRSEICLFKPICHRCLFSVSRVRLVQDTSTVYQYKYISTP